MIAASDRLTRTTLRDISIGLLLLAATLAAVDLAIVNRAAGVVLYAVIAGAAIWGIAAHRPHGDFGWANRITLFRTVMVCALASAAIDGDLGPTGMWLVTAVAALALILDGVDGWIARRSGTGSRFGARFDMEIDALTVLVLAALLWRQDKVGAWVLLAGGLRYLFVAAGRLWPRLNAPLPPRERRRAICAVMIVALVVACAPIVPPALAAALTAAGLALTALSFAIDVIWLLKQPTATQVL
jgi:phosphatidylglycerophosphate synthase